MVALDPPVTDSHGITVNQRVSSITFRATTPLPEGYRDTLEIAVQLPETEGATLAFPTVQTCEQGEVSWVELGQGGEALAYPLPRSSSPRPSLTGTRGTRRRPRRR